MSAATIMAVLTAVYEFARMVLAHESEDKIQAVAKELAEGFRLKNESKDTSVLEKALRDHIIARGGKL